MNSLCWMLLYFLHLVHKLKWSGCLACCSLLLDLLSRHVSQMVILIGCACCRKRARKEKKIFARARQNAKSFSSPPKSSLTHHGAAMSRVRPAMSSQIQELDNQHYVRFDRHAIAVAAIGDDCNNSFYLPRKHHSIWSTHKRSFSPSPADHIMLPPTARQQQHVCFDPHAIAVPTVVDHRNNLANMH